ncbi:MAG: hypothetical protein ABIH23_09135 [bacterium]
MCAKFYRDEDPKYNIVDSMRDSLRYTTRRCLTTYNGNLCATSSFVDPAGEPALWHEFGAVEGIGWAANAIGGAAELLAYGEDLADPRATSIGVSVLYHGLEDGFIHPDGTVTPYRDIPSDKRYRNFLHRDDHDDWLCPGSVAHIALQCLWAADRCQADCLKQRLRSTALLIASWMSGHLGLCTNGWYPRRCAPNGTAYPLESWGVREDAQFDHSGDGTYIMWLFTELTARGLLDKTDEVRRAWKVYSGLGGCFGSINHDTHDDQENVAYSVGFRCLLRVADLLKDPTIQDWAFKYCLEPLQRFQMTENRNGVETQGLLYMEDSWDTCYLWENAEAAMAYLEAAHRGGGRECELNGLTILRTAARHHHGEYGFLTEGVDWNNHNGVWREVDGRKIPIHVGGVTYGDVNYTQPFLNNMHITTPTLFYLKELAVKRETDMETVYRDCEGNILLRVTHG